MGSGFLGIGFGHSCLMGPAPAIPSVPHPGDPFAPGARPERSSPVPTAVLVCHRARHGPGSRRLFQMEGPSPCGQPLLPARSGSGTICHAYSCTHPPSHSHLPANHSERRIRLPRRPRAHQTISFLSPDDHPGQNNRSSRFPEPPPPLKPPSVAEANYPLGQRGLAGRCLECAGGRITKMGGSFVKSGSEKAFRILRTGRDWWVVQLADGKMGYARAEAGAHLIRKMRSRRRPG